MEGIIARLESYEKTKNFMTVKSLVSFDISASMRSLPEVLIDKDGITQTLMKLFGNINPTATKEGFMFRADKKKLTLEKWRTRKVEVFSIITPENVSPAKSLQHDMLINSLKSSDVKDTPAVKNVLGKIFGRNNMSTEQTISMDREEENPNLKQGREILRVLDENFGDFMKTGAIEDFECTGSENESWRGQNVFMLSGGRAGFIDGEKFADNFASPIRLKLTMKVHCFRRICQILHH